MVDIHRVGVIGAGQMGSGIAHVCALAGLDVALNDVSEERVKAGIATINGNLARQVVKQAISGVKGGGSTAMTACPDATRSRHSLRRRARKSH
jgi:3-hydroxyacyl-CoA dehydrogenase